MSLADRGRPVLAALLLILTPGAALSAALEILSDDDAPPALIALPDDGGWCLDWRHSVTGGAVRDCFTIAGGRMTLERSYLHDAAAGLGHIAGRGTQRSAAGGGYWIEDIDERVAGDALRLRVGGPDIGHRITAGDAEFDLTRHAAGQRVTLRPAQPSRGE